MVFQIFNGAYHYQNSVFQSKKQLKYHQHFFQEITKYYGFCSKWLSLKKLTLIIELLQSV